MSGIKKGTFIVIEGGDGSGKGTQSQLLMQYLQNRQIPSAYLDFPNYDSFFGRLVAKFLRGELGRLDEVSPYLASLPFALDRNAMKESIQQYVRDGKIFIVNRYVSSNMAHQGSKINNEQERTKFLEWLEELEYTVHNIPKPDLTIFLNMPWQQAKELTANKKDRKYLYGQKQDIQEADERHRMQTEKMYLSLASHDSSWKTMNCVENGTIVSKEHIHEMIINLLKSEHIIS